MLRGRWFPIIGEDIDLDGILLGLFFFFLFSGKFLQVGYSRLSIHFLNSYKACNATKSVFCFGFGSTRSCVPKYLSRLTCDPLAAHHPEVL